ncbi:MAG TPA: UDP-glucuronic acid decarboxylase family protein [Acetobacteraceae bacterium]|nr:UDP-glucuronic acid decarboxylase family protein [Acetobacteraceae bacterium]
MTRGADRTVLIAGGAGFIGSHLCEAMLADGARVICLDNLLTGRPQNIRHLRSEPRFEFIQADVIDRLPKLPRLDAVLNLACAASPPRYQADPVHTLMTSVVGTRNLLSLAQDNRARFLLASTSEVYGDPEVHPQKESYLGNVNPTGPRACYDEGKRAAETLCFDHLRLGRVDVRVARIFNTYGPRMSPDDGRVVSNVVNQALWGAPITLYGDGRQTRSFCYVDDLVGGLQSLLMHPGRLSGPVNLGNPAEITVAALVDMVIRMSRSRSPVVNRPLPVDDPRRRCPDITQARELLGWEPAIPLEQGLRRTITWFAAEQGIRPHLVQVAPAPHGGRGARVRAAAGD